MDHLQGAVSSWIGSVVTIESQVPRGDEAEVWIASCGDGRCVVHVSPPWRSPEEVGWCHRVALHAARQVQEVVAPRVVDGHTFFMWSRRPVAVFPFVDGAPLDRDDPAQVAEAARLLARLHGALLDWSGGDPPHRRIAGADDPSLEDRELDRQWQAGTTDGRVGVCHGDFYRRNVLVSDGQICAVIDWHDAYVGPLIGEVAFAAWEFGHDQELHLRRPAFDLFIEAYRHTNTHVRPSEYDIVPVAVRAKLRDNIRWALAHGSSIDDDYQRRQVAAFWELQRDLAGWQVS